MSTGPQLPLELVPEPAWLRNPRTRIEKRFAEFHRANPHVLAELEQRALRLLAADRRRIGVALLFEAMRYDALIRTTGEPFKLNNDFRSLYARLLIYRRAELADVIETRQRKERVA